MRNLAVLVIHLIATLARLLGPGGVRSLARGQGLKRNDPHPEEQAIIQAAPEIALLLPTVCPSADT